MKKVCIFILISVMLLTSCNHLFSKGTDVSIESVTKIVYFAGGGLPPAPENASTEAYQGRTTFFPDGKVVREVTAYDGTKLESIDWTVSSENFKNLFDDLVHAGFFELPEVFIYDLFDAGHDYLAVYSGDEVFSSTHASGHENVDRQSYECLSSCVELFSKHTTK